MPHRLAIPFALVCLAASRMLAVTASVTLTSIARTHELQNTPTMDNDVLLTDDDLQVQLSAGSRRAVCNGILTWLNAPPFVSHDGIRVSEADARLSLEPLLSPESILTPRHAPTVVIDPGHGGDDTGALAVSGPPEKDIVFDIAGRVRRKLQSSGIRARLTRDGDQTLALHQRTDRARRWDADIYVSIHANSAANTAASGIETYILPAPGFASTAGSSNNVHAVQGNAYDAASMLLGFYVHKGALSHTGEADRGIKRARFEVLCSAPCPALLVECGFLSNPNGAQRLADGAYRDRLSEGIAQGVLTYISRLDPL